MDIKAEGAIREAPFKVTGRVGAMDKMDDPNTAWPLELACKAEDTDMEIRGTIEHARELKGIRLNLKVNAKSPAFYEKVLGRPLPSGVPVSFQGMLEDKGPKVFRISDISVRSDKSDIEGSAELDLNGDHPALTASLSSKLLDLRPFFDAQQAEGAKTASGEPAGKKRLFPDTPLPVDALGFADAQIDLSAQKVFLPRAALDRLDLHAALKDGGLTVRPMTAVVGNGSMDGQLSLESKDDRLNVKTEIRVSKLDVGQMLAELNITDALEGTLDFEADVETLGKSVAELASGLKGHSSVVMGKGMIAHRYVDLLGGDLSAGVFRLINPLRREGNKTDINCFVNRFDFKDGIAECSALVFDTDRISVVGGGHIDLATEKLDLFFRPRPRKASGKAVCSRSGSVSANSPSP